MMEIDRFIKLRPYLYHLTYRDNLKSIIESGKLLSTKSLKENSGNPYEENSKMSRRKEKQEVTHGSHIVYIRDQKTIFESNLRKCLPKDWTCEKYYDHLNSRVFMWSTCKYLSKFYKSYANENSIILRFNSKDIIDRNQCVEFCEINSGATRSNSSYGGAPPPRGPETFKSAELFGLPPWRVKEVTFENECIFNGDLYVFNSQEKAYKKKTYCKL